MGKASRRKGLVGEREVADVFERAAWDVRGLEASGDWLCARRSMRGVTTLHVETKRAEALRIMEWVRQAEAECQVGATPIVAFRRSREPWRVVLRLEDLLGLLG